ncbi:MAG: tol-pal system-associated acyl-CoA thioesterase [Rhodocyclaceae bacterium]
MQKTETPGAVFDWPVRVYYEDTDAGGVVYHANYLKFCERARTEFLRQRGLDQGELKAREGLVFVVARVEADYLRGAELDDALVVQSRVQTLGQARVIFDQTILRGEERVFRGSFAIACMDWVQRRAVRIPDPLKELFMQADED